MKQFEALEGLETVKIESNVQAKKQIIYDQNALFNNSMVNESLIIIQTNRDSSIN